MAFPTSDRQYALITNAATRTAESLGGLGAILTQMDAQGNHFTVSFASRQLKDCEKKYSPFLLEIAAAVWEVFNKYLIGKTFILFTDHKHLENLDICTQKCSTNYNVHYLNMALWCNTKKEPTCLLTSCLDYRLYLSTLLTKTTLSLLLILFNQSCLNCECKIHIYKQFFSFSNMAIIKCTYLNTKFEFFQCWLRKFSSIKTSWHGS